MLFFEIFRLLVISFSKSENTQNVPTIPPFMIEIATFALLFQTFEPYFILTFFDEGHLKACERKGR